MTRQTTWFCSTRAPTELKAAGRWTFISESIGNQNTVIQESRNENLTCGSADGGGGVGFGTA